MTTLSGGQAAIKALQTENVRHLFGLIGSASMEIFDALYDSPTIRFIGVRDERTGVHMADGYARASGGAGVFLAGQNGPGATNLVTGLAQAAAAFSPVVSLAGALSSAHIYRDAFQEVDQQSLFVPITKKTYTITQTARIPEILHTAFRTALSPRRGPVHVNIPRDILATTAEFTASGQPSFSHHHHSPAATEADITAAIQLLQEAKRPLIIVGGGVKNRDGSAAALALAETLAAPVVAAPGHGDAAPFGHRLSMGQMGPRGNAVATRLAQEADVILALGTRLGFNTTFYSYDYINAAAKIIHVELDATALGRYFPVAVGIWGDATQIAQQLRARWHTTHAEAIPWATQCQQARAAYLQARDQQAERRQQPIHPTTLFKELRRVLPEDTAFTMDAGTLCLQATDAFNYGPPPCLFTPLDFGLVGFSFACGLGVKLAQPKKTVLSLIGDGGFGMTLSELSTAVSYGINTVTLVLNNQCWGAEKAYQRDFFGGRYIGADLHNPPFDQVAELYGAAGFRVNRVADIAEAVATALTCNKPAVLDIAIDPAALYSFRRDSFTHRKS